MERKYIYLLIVGADMEFCVAFMKKYKYIVGVLLIFTMILGTSACKATPEEKAVVE